MDKVRKALDRAREERDAAGIADRAVLASPDPEPDAPAEEIGLPPPSAALARAFDIGAGMLQRNRVLLPDDRSPAAQSFRMLRTQVLQTMRSRGWQTIGVVSARSMDGKTTVAANLAIAIASDPRHTAILVDLDLQRPAVARVFGASMHAGVDAVLHERATVDSVMLRPSGIDRLRLLPAQSDPQPPGSALVARPSCASLMGELRSRYTNRIIVVDMPPVLDNDDALTLAPLCDCLLFVVSEGRTARADVTRALTLLRDSPILGTVLNNATAAAANRPRPAG